MTNATPQFDLLAVLGHAVTTYRELNCSAPSPEDHRLDIEDAARALRVVRLLLDVTRRAEEFVAGFEDDESQEGVVVLLGDMRAAMRTVRMDR